jgi:5'-methylthioadenosine phosphorylase
MVQTDKPPVGLIGGTGIYDPTRLMGFQPEGADEVPTPYGAVVLTRGRIGGRPVHFLNRHGHGHSIPPHRVNYRANVWALKASGVRWVLATAAVGSLTADLRPGALVLVDQFLDFTKGRHGTFFDGEGSPTAGVVHTDVTAPYCTGLRAALSHTAVGLGVELGTSATYVCTEGPRFESAAEIRAFRCLGGTVVGMTGVPEVVLARELGMCYATVCLVTNLGAGLSAEVLTHEEVTTMVARRQQVMTQLLSEALTHAGEAPCACPPTPAGFV